VDGFPGIKETVAQEGNALLEQTIVNCRSEVRIERYLVD
jgi:hypothetical protein